MGTNRPAERYDFSLNDYDTLDIAADEAASRIYSAGLMFRNDQIGPGGNNVMADAAASAFNRTALQTLLHNPRPRPRLCGVIIALRQEYMAAADGAVGNCALQDIYQTARDLKTTGWQPVAEPLRLNHPAP